MYTHKSKVIYLLMLAIWKCVFTRFQTEFASFQKTRRVAGDLTGVESCVCHGNIVDCSVQGLADSPIKLEPWFCVTV